MVQLNFLRFFPGENGSVEWGLCDVVHDLCHHMHHGDIQLTTTFAPVEVSSYRHYPSLLKLLTSFANTLTNLSFFIDTNAACMSHLFFPTFSDIATDCYTFDDPPAFHEPLQDIQITLSMFLCLEKLTIRSTLKLVYANSMGVCKFYSSILIVKFKFRFIPNLYTKAL